MPPNISRDLTFRASMQNDIPAGAAKVKESVKQTTKEVESIQAEAERSLQQKLRKQAVEAETSRLAKARGIKGVGGGEGAFGRIFSDQSTTGLGPLGRALSQGLGEHLGTGLVVGGIAVAGAQLAEMTGRAVTFRDTFIQADKGAGEMAVSLGESIPILGKLIEAGQNIRELATGEKYQLQLEVQTREKLLDLADRQYAVAIKNNMAEKERAVALSALARESAGVGLRGITGAQYSFNSERAAADAAFNLKETGINNTQRDEPVKTAAQKALDEFNTSHAQRISDLTELAKQPMSTGLRGGVVHSDNPVAKAELQGLLDSQTSLLKARDKARDAAKTVADKAHTDNQSNHAESIALIEAQHAEWVKLHAEERRQIAQTHAAEVAASFGGAGAENLGTMGNAAAAKRAEIQVSADAQRAQASIEADARTRATSDAGERQEIANQLGMKLLAITVKQTADIAAADKAMGVERRRIVFDAGQATADATAQAEAQRLREVGQGYEAEKSLRKREYDRQTAEIDEHAQAEIVQNRDNAAAILAKAASDRASLASKYREGERQAGESRRAGEFSGGKDLLDFRVNALKDEARYGGLAAGVEARRLEIASEYASKREELNRLIRDPNTNAAMKAQAQAELGGLDAAEKRRLAFSVFTGGTPVTGLHIMARGSGLAARSAEENSTSAVLARNTEDMKKGIVDMNRGIADMVSMLRNIPSIREALAGLK